ncbi:MAG: MotA/TolQ/ExbB proton channel family protein [Proteobacteria bacterium]|nr:MotA/TolQ/ExbB proton channel family protein [Pseudomonadota bacterium]MBU1610627.1 MotA/TolQ/ExbB proton channel family protein [Pseudomonadota bacterium]
MNKRNIFGIIVCAAAFLGSFAIVGGPAAYWNLTAFLVVLGGLGCAALLSYPFEKIAIAFKVAQGTYTQKQTTPEQLVSVLLDLAVKCKVDGILSMEKIQEKTTISFLKNGLMFLVDNYTEQEIRDFLSTEMSFFNLRRQQSERVFQTLARVAPAFGVAGSVIGLIGLLMGIQDTAVILQSIPVAFISTLYGVVLGNMIFSPMAEAIHFNTRSELLNQKLIMEGIVAIANEQNTYKIEKKLCSFLAPSQREGKAERLRSVTKRYLQKKRMSVEEAAEMQADLDIQGAKKSKAKEVVAEAS